MNMEEKMNYLKWCLEKYVLSGDMRYATLIVDEICLMDEKQAEIEKTRSYALGVLGKIYEMEKEVEL